MGQGQTLQTQMGPVLCGVALGSTQFALTIHLVKVFKIKSSWLCRTEEWTRLNDKDQKSSRLKWVKWSPLFYD